MESTLVNKLYRSYIKDKNNNNERKKKMMQRGSKSKQNIMIEGLFSQYCQYT